MSNNITRLTEDATNRAWRTLLVGVAIDVAVAIALVLVTYFSERNSWGEIEWAALGFSLSRSIVQALGAFVLRRFVDASSFPTPLPPAPVPPPADH